MSNNKDQGRPYFVLNQAGIMEEVSEAFCSFTEFSKEELVGNTADHVFPGLMRAEMPFHRFEQPAETFLFTKTLQYKHISAYPILNEPTRTVFAIEEIPNSSFEKKNYFIMQIFEENKIGVGLYTPEQTLILANEKYLGYLPKLFQSRETAYGRNLRNMVPHWSLLPREGIRFWENSLLPVKENGKTEYLISFLFDVEEKVLSEELMKEQKEWYELLLDNMSDGLICIDQDYDIIHMNKAVKAFRDLYGINFKVEPYYDVHGIEIPWEDLPSRKVLRGETVHHHRFMIRKNGRQIYIECNGSAIRNRDGSLKYGILNFRDVTTTIEYENRIKSQKEELDALLDNMVEGMIIADPHGYVIRMNKAAMQMLNLAEASSLNHIQELSDEYELTDLDGNILTLKEKPIARVGLFKGKFSNLELWIHFKKIVRDPCLCSFAGIPIYNEQGEFLYSILTFKDITEQWRTQEKLMNAVKEKNEILSEAMAFKDEFLYLITHEMKTPLAVINSALQTIQILHDDLPGKLVKYLRTIKQNTNRQLRLVNNLLEIIRINSGKIVINNDFFDIVDLTDMVVRSIQSYATQKEVEVIFLPGITKKIIYIDEEKVEWILMNLLSNALKFTPKGKAIKVRVYTRKMQGKSKVCISVSDEGIGIPRDKQNLIFERFGQVRRNPSKPSEGTGIGLYLVKLLVELMNGSITLESEVGKGSNFTVILPDVRPKQTDFTEKKTSEELESDSRLTNETEIQLSDIYF